MASHTHTHTTQANPNSQKRQHTHIDCKLFSAWLCLGSVQDASRMTKHSLTDTCGRAIGCGCGCGCGSGSGSASSCGCVFGSLLSRRSDGSTRNELMMGQGKFQFASVRFGIGLRPNKSLVILRAMSKYVGLKGSSTSYSMNTLLHTHSPTHTLMHTHGLHMFSWPAWLAEKCFFMLA